MASFRSQALRITMMCTVSAAASAVSTAASALPPDRIRSDSLGTDLLVGAPRQGFQLPAQPRADDGVFGEIALPPEYETDIQKLSAAQQSEYAQLFGYLTQPSYTATTLKFSDMMSIRALSASSRCAKDNVGDINEALRRVNFAVSCQVPYAFTAKPLPANFGACLLYERTADEQTAYNIWKNSSDDPSLETMPGCSAAPKPPGKAQFTSMWVDDANGVGTPFVPVGAIPANHTECVTRMLAPAGLEIEAVCGVGCYAPEQRVLFASGELPIAEARDREQRDIVTLDPTSTRGDVRLMKNRVQNYVADIAPARQELVSIHTQSGGNVRVTKGHPMLVENGNMQPAAALRVGDKLVRADGATDAIVFIESDDFFGKVYNVNPETTDETSNIMVAEGYLAGSHRVQTKELDYERRRFLRDAQVDAE